MVFVCIYWNQWSLILDENEVKEEPQKNDEKSAPKPKKDIFRPYCLKDPDIKPFKLPSYSFKVRHTATLTKTCKAILFSPTFTTRCFHTSPHCFSLRLTPSTSSPSSLLALVTCRPLRVLWSRSLTRSEARSQTRSLPQGPQLLGNQVRVAGQEKDKTYF